MKIAIAQISLQTGAFEENNLKIIEQIRKANAENVDLIVFSELTIGTYAAKDLWYNDNFLKECERSLEVISNHCVGIACVIGTPTRNDGKGKSLYNSAVFIKDGKVTHIHHKNHLPSYDVFDENRYFQSGNKATVVNYKGQKIALTICEDLWDKDNTLYNSTLLEDIKELKPDILINIAASPFSYLQNEKRKAILKHTAKELDCSIIYSNHLGGYTDLIFDGSSLVVNTKGIPVYEMASFTEDLAFINFQNNNFVIDRAEEGNQNKKTKIELVHKALIYGIRQYFSKNNFTKALIGLSGGLDSALVAALACEALGADNVLCVLLPSAYSSNHSIKDAEELVQNTGCKTITISIQPTVETFESQLEEAFEGYNKDVTEENIQARTRAVILMALSNKLGYILLNTSNKSESAVGYGTLYGDMAGALAVIGDLYKTEAYELSYYINNEKEIIPHNILIKAPSAELRPDQKDSDSLPPYEILDAILYQLIEGGRSKAWLIEQNYDDRIVERVCNLLAQSEYKRKQSAPVLRISPKALGIGRQFPLVGKTIF